MKKNGVNMMIMKKCGVNIMSENKLEIEKDVAICISILNNMQFKHKSVFTTLDSFYKYVENTVNSFKNKEELEEYIMNKIKK